MQSNEERSSESHIKPVGNRLVLLPNESRMRGIIQIPDIYKDGSTACMVLARGPKADPQIKEGATVLCEAAFGERKNMTIGDTKAFWATDQNIYALLEKGKIIPYGRKVLIRRDVDDAMVGGIVIPENRRFQSLYGTIERLGRTRLPFKTNGLKIGLRIRLTEWEAHYAQVELEDGGHGVIVNEKDILFFES